MVALYSRIDNGGRQHYIQVALRNVLFTARGTAAGSIEDLVRTTLHNLDLHAAATADHGGDRYLVVESQTPAMCLDGADPVELFRRRLSEPLQLLHLLELRIILASRIQAHPVELSSGALQGTGYTYGSGQVTEHHALRVFTDANTNALRPSRLSVRLIDAAGTVTDLIADPTSQELLPYPATPHPDQPARLETTSAH
ncbi:hypothetical protein ACIBF1_30460 [Spirillospora sp. NPDC050679]